MESIRNDLLKLWKLSWTKWCLISYFLILTFILYQKGLSKFSGFYQSDRLQPFYIVGFLMSCSVVIGKWMILLVGAYLAEMDTQYKTWLYLMPLQSRFKVVLTRVCTVLIIILIHHISIVIIGVGFGLACSGFQLDIYLLHKILKLSLSSAILLFTYSLIGMFISYLFKSHVYGIIYSIFLLNMGIIIGPVVKNFNKYDIDWYMTGMLYHGTTFLKGDYQLSLYNVNYYSYVSHISGVIILVVFFLVSCVFLLSFREFRE